MTKYEDCGNAPVVMSPFKPVKNHMTVPLTRTSTSILLPNDDCVMIMLQSTGGGSVRFTLDGTTPIYNSKGFILTSSMSPIVLNLCGHSTTLMAVGSNNSGCVLEIQISE